jgi:DNA-binding MarR family transcriptional regulator
MSQLPESQSLGHLLVQVCRLHHARAHALFDEIGLYRGQPPVLRALWEQDGRTHSELAAQLHVKPATITKMIQRMARAGFVTCRSDPDDQRVSRVYLTDAGHAIQSQVLQVMQAIDAETFEGFRLEERVLMRRFLLQIRENLVRATGKELSC